MDTPPPSVFTPGISQEDSEAEESSQAQSCIIQQQQSTQPRNIHTMQPPFLLLQQQQHIYTSHISRPISPPESPSSDPFGFNTAFKPPPPPPPPQQQQQPTAPASPHFGIPIAAYTRRRVTPARRSPVVSSSSKRIREVEQHSASSSSSSCDNPYFPTIEEQEREERRARQLASFAPLERHARPFYRHNVVVVGGSERQGEVGVAAAMQLGLDDESFSRHRRPSRVELPSRTSDLPVSPMSMGALPGSTATGPPLSVEAYNRGMRDHVREDMRRRLKDTAAP